MQIRISDNISQLIENSGWNVGHKYFITGYIRITKQIN